MTETVTCRRLDWDSGYFGLRYSRMELNAAVSRQALQRALEEAKGEDFLCIADHSSELQNARLIGELTAAYPADVLIQLEKPLSKPVAGAVPLTQDRFPYAGKLVEMANRIFRNSRFVRDSEFASRGGASVYGEWVKNAFERPGEFFLTESVGGTAAGFVLFRIREDTLVIELFGVDDGRRNCGIGRRLWAAAEEQARAHGCSSIQVGTQLANISAMNFYIAMGCLISQTVSIYHLWMQKPEAVF